MLKNNDIHPLAAAVSDAHDMYLINGDFRLDWPEEYPYGGTMVKYTRNQTTETLSAQGPTLVDLYVKVRRRNRAIIIISFLVISMVYSCFLM